MPSEFLRPGSSPRPVVPELALPRNTNDHAFKNGHDGANFTAEASNPASPSARPKDVVDSYLRQLYGGDTPTRALAAQGLGALASFLPCAQAPNALRLAVQHGVVSSLSEVMCEDEQLAVQEACLMGLASLLLATAPYEEHSAPLRPPHLKQLAACLLRPVVLQQLGYVLTATTSSRVVLAAARVVTIMAPYITQSNDIHILDSRIIPALVTATASAAPAPPLPPAAGGGSSTARAAPTVASITPIATPRDSAACALALMALAQATPDLFIAVRNIDFLQALGKLYERCIQPDQPAGLFYPVDAAALLLRALRLEPHPRWVASMPKGYSRELDAQLEESHALDCLVSYLAVEGTNLRQLGEDVAAVAADNARAVMEKNGRELEHLKEQQRERQQQLTELREAARDARRAVELAEAGAAAAQKAHGTADAVVQASRNGGSPEQRRARREAEAEAARAEEEVMERRRALAATEDAAAGLRAEVAALRRAAGPVRWQNERMARLEAAVRAWRDRFGAKTKSKVRVTRPNTAMLTEVLSYLANLLKPVSVIERGSSGQGGGRPVLPAGAPSPENVVALQARLLAAGMVQALLQLSKFLSAVRALAEELAALAGDLALQPDMAAALGGAAEVLGREAAALGEVNTRAEMRLKQVNAEVHKLRKSLKLGFPEAGNPGRRQLVELGPGNGLSREVHRHDVEKKLRSLEEESEDLTTVLASSRGLVEMLEAKLKSVTEAASALSDCHAKFIKAFPAQASPATPAQAPTASSPAATMSLASNHIMAKDASHPAGHLLGLLARALAPLTAAQGPWAAPNLAALVRQLKGRPPDGGGATWPPPPPVRPLSASEGSGNGAWSVGSASRQASVRSLTASGGGLGGGGDGAAATARSIGGIYRERSSASGGFHSPRGNGGYGVAFGESGYGGGFGGFSGFQGAGPFPTDGQGRPMRYPQESMYGIIQATHSPLRGYSSPSNGPNYALLSREKAAVRSSGGAAASSAGGGAAARSSRTSTGAGGMRNSFNSTLTAGDRTAFPGPAMALSISMPIAEESRRVVHQAMSSVLFDPVDPDVLGPGVLRASGSAAFGGGAFGSRLPTAYGSSGGGSAAAAAAAVALPPPPAAEVSIPSSSPRSVAAPPRSSSADVDGITGDGVGDGDVSGGGPEISVLDALLMQTGFLCDVLNALASIQHLVRTTIRTCRQLPASVSYASLQPGSLGIFMARLHGLWAEALAKHPDMRVQVTGAVTQIAELALVPAHDYQSVYKETGMVEVLVQMLAGQLRPASKTADRVPASGASSSGGNGVDDSGGLKPRHVGRLTATAPPTLRLGPAQAAEQAAAAQALRAISHAQAEVLASIGQDDKLLARLSTLCLDHSMSWTARLAASELLSDLVLGGGPAAEAAVAAGAYAALVEVLNRDMYPFLNQDPRCSKESVVSALACISAHPELLEGVLAAAQTPSGPSSGLPLQSTEEVMSAILRSLWGVCKQAHALYTSDRTGHGRFVDPELVSGLMSTAATAARELAVLADTTADARLTMNGELKLGRKLSVEFLQAVKDPPLLEALLALRKNLS